MAYSRKKKIGSNSTKPPSLDTDATSETKSSSLDVYRSRLARDALTSARLAQDAAQRLGTTVDKLVRVDGDEATTTGSSSEPSGWVSFAVLVILLSVLWTLFGKTFFGSDSSTKESLDGSSSAQAIVDTTTHASERVCLKEMTKLHTLLSGDNSTNRPSFRFVEKAREAGVSSIYALSPTNGAKAMQSDSRYVAYKRCGQGILFVMKDRINDIQSGKAERDHAATQPSALLGSLVLDERDCEKTIQTIFTALTDSSPNSTRSISIESLVNKSNLIVAVKSSRGDALLEESSRYRLWYTCKQHNVYVDKEWIKQQHVNGIAHSMTKGLINGIQTQARAH